MKTMMIAFLAMGLSLQHADHQAPAPAATPPLYSNLGDHHYRVTVATDKAQAYFDQGLRLYYAFNHAEAIRSFREAQRLDPSCAMCWWGEAIAWGPNINLPMDSPSGVAAYAALQKAIALKGKASERERALIDALATRYAANPPANRAALDQAYANAMAKVAAQYPDDLEISVLYSEAQMDLSPWNYWTKNGQPQPGMEQLAARLEKAIERNPRHPGACHFYIHAVEAAYPERAVPCAERLAALMPGAGHLVHMPGHIYIRVGRYEDAIKANEHAVHADESYIRDQRPGPGMYTAGYYPHNYDFLAFAASLVGRSEVAVDSAKKVAAVIPKEMLTAPGMTSLQNTASRPLQMMVRFGKWNQILASPTPPAEQILATAISHYARGRAFAATGKLTEAKAELTALRRIAEDPAAAEMRMEFNQAKDILAIAVHVLAGRIAAQEKNFDQAVSELRAAAGIEDGLTYGEPPEWSVPVRHDLGAVLLEAGRPVEAEQAYRQDLKRFPANGWSLVGLEQALRAQKRDTEAREAEAQLKRAWAKADIQARSSAF